MKAAVVTRYGPPEVLEIVDVPDRIPGDHEIRVRIHEDLELLRSLIEAGELRRVISRRYALRDIADAHRYADTGHKVGNVSSY